MNVNYYDQLTKFLSQAKTDDLKTKDYEKKLHSFEIKVSFGQGNTARIPWISFLKHPNTTSNGIYPVYLYYKTQNILILAYGISETNKPNSEWPVEDAQTISTYFSQRELGIPERYGMSFVCKVYDVEKLPDETTINRDLAQILTEYDNINFVNNPEKDISIKQIDFDIKGFDASLKSAGLRYSSKTTSRLVSSLITKPFVLLTGLSGSGKTKLAQAFASWICGDNAYYCIIPVGADWTNRDPLLGYPNALKNDEYIKPENGALDILISANINQNIPHFLILDEMNLSHVERYFSDFLSTMESGEEIPLHSNENISVPQMKINLPNNLFIIGTVNIDETTYMFSPKVLDRANTIEFRVNKDEIEEYLNSSTSVDLSQLSGKGTPMCDSFLNLAKSDDTDKINDELKSKLLSFFCELKKVGAEFGYRSASEIIRLIYNLGIVSTDLSDNEKMDIAIMQKLLPKLHGSRRKLCPVLLKMAGFCVEGIDNIETDVFKNEEFIYQDNNNVLFPLSLEKISRMYNGAIDNGFASYAEA